MIPSCRSMVWSVRRYCRRSRVESRVCPCDAMVHLDEAGCTHYQAATTLTSGCAVLELHRSRLVQTDAITNSSQSQAETAEPRSCDLSNAFEASAQCVLVETTRRTTNCSLASAVFTWIAATPKPGLDFPLPADDGSKEISAADRTKAAF